MSAPPTAVVLFVRHAHVPSVSDAERTSDLSRHGRRDAARVTVRLANFAGVIATNSTERAHATVESVADAADAPLIVDDDLKERELTDSPTKDFDEAVEHLWANPNASRPGGESHAEAQACDVAAVDRLVEAYLDRYVAVDIHAVLMALVFNAYDPRYGRKFWTRLMTPDVYEMTPVDSEVFSIARTWTPEEVTCEDDANRDPAER